ncbi:hypothetical protein L202_07650 [Cryptococcus amylolentus CBS 6039]|uniref:DUF676 domain-containing protein n=1 Tax=Cryptococcus amylolentus CBS 6039 TaxID=1295533 RepID=A0A1E3HCZ8_9TREE|nr:hypothetical protein L202_07650 [Cryptococcus amylolentus CBS 6039]ODN74204.1 hypothetical protein L202_07650 [Cryptococcus amylolentus CBS 6039]
MTVQVWSVTLGDPKPSSQVAVSPDIPHPPASRRSLSPLALLARDALTILRNASYIPLILWPISLKGKGADITNKGKILQVVMFVSSIVLTGGAVGAFVAGVPSPIMVVASIAGFIKINNVLQGGTRIDPPEQHYQRNKYPEESWLFVNGIATSTSGLKLIQERLFNLFGRPVIGIHNRTYGIWFDLVECMVQRDLLWETTDIRDGYNVLTKELEKPEKKKVVLIAHSQGGIITSAWVDRLVSQYSPETLSKLEIYTFASAANHFSVPVLEPQPFAPISTSSGGSSTKVVGGRDKTGSVFKHVEHFGNTGDFVSRIGVLGFAPHPKQAVLEEGEEEGEISELRGIFAGMIFERHNTTGHLLLSH